MLIRFDPSVSKLKTNHLLYQLFNNTECDNALEQCLSLPSFRVENNVYRATFRPIPLEDNFKWLYDRMSKSFMKSNFDNFNYDLIGISEYPQLVSYEKDDFCNWHRDITQGNVIRKLTAIVQLSDPTSYQGGNVLEFETSEVNLCLKDRGSASIFSSFITSSVRPIESGTCHQLMFWTTGPNFR